VSSGFCLYSTCCSARVTLPSKDGKTRRKSRFTGGGYTYPGDEEHRGLNLGSRYGWVRAGLTAGFLKGRFEYAVISTCFSSSAANTAYGVLIPSIKWNLPLGVRWSVSRLDVERCSPTQTFHRHHTVNFTTAVCLACICSTDTTECRGALHAHLKPDGQLQSGHQHSSGLGIGKFFRRSSRPGTILPKSEGPGTLHAKVQRPSIEPRSLGVPSLYVVK